MAQANVQQLQIVQHNLQAILAQKQQLQQQLIEIESALAELQTTEKAYKMVGKLLVASSPEKLKKELLEKKETTSLRLKHFSQQEEKVRKNAEELQAAVVSELKQKGSVWK